MINKLQVISESKTPPPKTHIKTHREQVQAHYERKWHQNPDQFQTSRSAKERERIKRTIQLIKDTMSLKGKHVVDLGCGDGQLAKIIRDFGASVDAVDIAKNPLQGLQDKVNIHPIHSCVPNTHLDDNSYDLVVCTELIGHLSQREHRLFFNELARLVKRDGWIVCSTNVDIDSDDALDAFISLAETELEVTQFRLSYHGRFIRFLNLLKSPELFADASQNNTARKQEIAKRHSVSRWWFQLSSTKLLGLIWKGVSLISTPLYKKAKQNETLLSLFEKCSIQQKCISHVIVIAKRKPLEGFITGY